MRKIIFSLFIICNFLVGSAAHASGQMTLDDLQNICSKKDETSKNSCRFYIWGILEGFDLGRNITKDKSSCIPEDMSMTKAETLVKKSISDDLVAFPEDKTMPAASFVSAVFFKFFPCKP